MVPFVSKHPDLVGFFLVQEALDHVRDDRHDNLLITMLFQKYPLFRAHYGTRLAVLVKLEHSRREVLAVQIALEGVHHQVVVGTTEAIVALEVVRAVIDPVNIREGDHRFHLHVSGKNWGNGGKHGIGEDVTDVLDRRLGVVIQVVPATVDNDVEVIEYGMRAGEGSEVGHHAQALAVVAVVVWDDHPVHGAVQVEEVRVVLRVDVQQTRVVLQTEVLAVKPAQRYLQQLRRVAI